jgi:hypothetical protein
MRNIGAGLVPRVKAYIGPLPAGRSGIEFTTSVEPEAVIRRVRLYGRKGVPTSRRSNRMNSLRSGLPFSRGKTDMHTAPPDALLIDVRPALTAHVSESDFLRLFPVQFDEVDALAAAEPSKAALLRLDSGRLVVVEYGSITSTVTVSVPFDADARETLVDLLLEAPLDGSTIEWLSDDVGIFALELRHIRQEQRKTPSSSEQTSFALPSPRKN